MATTIAASIKEVNQSLRPLTRLVQFFAKYPPSQYSSLATGQAIPTSKQRIHMAAKPLSATNLPQAASLPVLQTMTAEEPSSPDSMDTLQPLQTSSPASQSPSELAHPPNPFLPYRNPETGRWRGARIGLRQQADLYKYAREHGVEELLPPSIKSSTYKQQRALERGLAMKGLREGERVKGHKWERTKASTMEKRRKAMEEMPDLIRQWEQKGHGRGWRKYPK